MKSPCKQTSLKDLRTSLSVLVRYLRSLPLHPTQEEIETYPDYSLFTLCVLPTFDFLQALMNLREFTEVIEPMELREMVTNIVAQMARTYRIIE